MKLVLQRGPSTAHSTPGELSVDGVFECYTLEDVVRPVKIAHETAIPAGVYKVIIDMSQRFQRLMPHVLDVPGFTGIRIHAGNTDKDTEGCILVGRQRSTDNVSESRLAYGTLFPKLQGATDITLEIKDA